LEFNGQVTYKSLFEHQANIELVAYIRDKERFKSSNYFVDLTDKTTLMDKKYDCIIATNLLYYFIDTKTVLANLKSMLKPNGTIIITNPGPIYPDIDNNRARVFFTTTGLVDVCADCFGHENIFDVKKYGDFGHAIYALLGLARIDKSTHDSRRNLTVITGLCCKNVKRK
jgi:SAM-dependent methyltransferase